MVNPGVSLQGAKIVTMMIGGKAKKLRGECGKMMDWTPYQL